MMTQLTAVLHWWPVLENTLRYAASRPDSAALSRPNSARFMGEMGLSARTAARRISGFQHLAHPLRLKTQPGGFCLDTEPETMPIQTAGSPCAARVAPTSGVAPSHYLRRVARSIIIRGALRGRLSWPVALLMLNKIGGTA